MRTIMCRTRDGIGMSPLTMAICCPSTGMEDDATRSWCLTATSNDWSSVHVSGETEGTEAGYLQKVQNFYLQRKEDVLGYLHSDLIIHEVGWDKRILAEFGDPSVAIVSFGGSKRHGTKDIYKVPYDFRQLARSPFISNLTDAEAHGTRETGSQTVAVLDSFAIFVRRAFLDRIGGWPVATFPPSHCSDYWLCLMAHRHHYRIRMVGVSATHRSGGVGLGGWDYPSWAKTTKWGSDEAMHAAGHYLIYDQFRDVLPVEVP